MHAALGVPAESVFRRENGRDRYIRRSVQQVHQVIPVPVQGRMVRDHPHGLSIEHGKIFLPGVIESRIHGRTGGKQQYSRQH